MGKGLMEKMGYDPGAKGGTTKEFSQEDLKNRASLFTLILGIETPLVVGFDEDGNLANELVENVDRLRPPVSDEERAAVPAYCLTLLEEIIPRIQEADHILDDLGVIPVTMKVVKEIAKNPRLYGRIVPTSWLVGSKMIRECKFCRHSFVAENVRAKYCQNKACQAERNKIKQRKFKKNQKRKMKIQK